MEISGKLSIFLQSNIDYDVYGFDSQLIKDRDEDNSENISFDNGKYEKEDLIPGNYEIAFEINSDKKFEVSSENYTEQDVVKSCSYNQFFLKPFKLDLEKRNFLIISDEDKDTSD